ncbi:MAG: sigma 54-interacting transcriptional regulator, partial [Hyphomicrobiaceae bacterium]
LRVLQEGEYTTVGGRVPLKTDVRIIAATNRDLRHQINQGIFREDLFYRLNVVPLRLPPLRERAEDIPDLVQHFLRQAVKAGLPERKIDRTAMDALQSHAWPGNVRELENLVQRVVALSPHDTIPRDAVTAELLGAAPENSPGLSSDDQTLSEFTERYLASHFASFEEGTPPPGLYQRVLHEIEVPLISAALAATRGNQIRAAELLGLNRNTLRKKIRDLDIKVIKSVL